MNKSIKNKIKLISVLLIIFGIICLVLEGIFYGDMDALGVLQESFFLPLGMLTLLLGIFIAFFLVFKRLLTLLFTKHLSPKQQ